MAKAQDINTVLKDIMGAFPVDTKAMEDAFKNQAALNEKLSGVALTAAEQSAEISNKWTKETLAKLNDMTKAKAEPADYAKAMTDFASASAEVAAENMAAFAEVAKKVQMETVELLMAAGKDLQEDAAKAVKKATDDVTAAAKKATEAPSKFRLIPYPYPPCRIHQAGASHCKARPFFLCCSSISYAAVLHFRGGKPLWLKVINRC